MFLFYLLFKPSNNLLSTDTIYIDGALVKSNKCFSYLLTLRKFGEKAL